MVWPIPSSKAIFEKLATTLEASLTRLQPSLEATAISRAVRSARGVFSQLLRPIAAELREVHDHQAYWARQYMPDSADSEISILSHADIWGVKQRGPLHAVGRVRIEGQATKVIPSGIELSASNGVLFITTASGVIDAAGTLSVPARAQAPGSSGNLETGVRLTPVTHQDGLARASVEAAISGGADEQSLEVKICLSRTHP